MNLNLDYVCEFLKRIMAIESPTGYTHHAIEFLEKEAVALGFSCSRNVKGNLIVEMEGKSTEKGIGVCAHTDTLGLMVRSIKPNGYLAITRLGGPLMPTLDGEYCTVITRENKRYSGTILSVQPAAHVFKEAATLSRTDETMEIRLDEVVKSAEDVKALGIQNGDIIAYDSKTVITESGFIKSRFLDDKMSVAILFGILEYFKREKIRPNFKTYFMFSTYEEVGHGMSCIPNDVTELLAVDMGCIGTDLACTEYDVSICAKDSGGPYDYAMTSHLMELAKKHELQYAVDIYPFYGSDVGAALSGGNNIKGALIGPGVCASHGMERTHKQAVENTLKLLAAYLTD